MHEKNYTPDLLQAKRVDESTFFLKNSEGERVAEVSAADEKHYKQFGANARLYAAAPAVVDALESLVSEIEEAVALGYRAPLTIRVAAAVAREAIQTATKPF